MKHIRLTDPVIADLIESETSHQGHTIRLIASENYASSAVQEAVGSALSNKYSEGYPHKRYYEGQDYIDRIEVLAIDRLKALFGSDHANVQPYSGSPANAEVYLAFCKPNDTIMGLALSSGGHLTHGHSVTFSGKFFNSVPYHVHPETHLIDMDQVRDLALNNKPRLIWCGATAYSRFIDYTGFRSIADEVGAILAADIAHVSGLVAANVHPSPVGIADVVTSTTHKTFRGPRGGIILCKSNFANIIDKAVFPGMQGGPHNNTTAAIAIAAHEASKFEFIKYARNIISNAKRLSMSLIDRGFNIITGGTDNHLILIDLTNKNISGKQASQALAKAGIISNYNTIPFDRRKPFDPSGLRIGLAAITSRGMGNSEMHQISCWIDRVVNDFNNENLLKHISEEVKELCEHFPAPGIIIY